MRRKCNGDPDGSRRDALCNVPKLVVKREERNKRGEWIMKVRKRIRRLILVIAATLIAYLFLVPLLFMVFTSFKGLSE